MKCDKNHTPIEWNEKDLFTCPSCILIDVQDNQRNVISNLQKALIESQNAQQKLTDILVNKNK